MCVNCSSCTCCVRQPKVALLVLVVCGGAATWCTWLEFDIDLNFLDVWQTTSNESNDSLVPYYKGENGTQCPIELAIRSQQTCEAAVQALGLCSRRTWKGYTSEIQSFCSYRDSCEKQRTGPLLPLLPNRYANYFH